MPVEIKDTYLCAAGAGTGQYKESGSRFIAFAWPVSSREEAMKLVGGLRSKYHDARHCCFAYRIGPAGEEWRANDDGEPSGSAGRPILGQLDSAGLSDTLVAVVRYFGGVKLGIPGLIRAYRTAAAEALADAGSCEKTACRHFILRFGYQDMNKVMTALKDLGVTPYGQDFGLECSLRADVRLSLTDAFVDKFSKICIFAEE